MRIALPDPYDPDPAARAVRAKLRRAAEQARRGLSTADEATIALEVDGQGVKAVLDKATFERIAEPLFKRLRQPVARALADSRIRSADLSHIVLAGGATRMPAVRRLAATLFGRVPRQTIDPDQVVALGAGGAGRAEDAGRCADGHRPYRCSALHAGNRSGGIHGSSRR